MVDKSASEASRTQQPMQDGQESYLRGQLEELRSQLLRAQEHMVELNAELCNRKEEAVERMRAAERASVSSGVGGRLPGLDLCSAFTDSLFTRHHLSPFTISSHLSSIEWS